MKAALLSLAASMVLLAACKKQAMDAPPKKPRQILEDHRWRLVEQITKQGTFDPFAEVPPEDVTVDTAGCAFNVIIAFHDDGSYTIDGDEPNCLWGSPEGITWELLEADSFLVFRKPGIQFGYVVQKISDVQMLLSSSAIGIDSGGFWAYLYRFEPV